MKSIDLFCGGGGSSIGFHHAGFTSQIAVDLEWHCVETYNSNFGQVAIQADISQLRSEQLVKPNDEITLVTASPPCEPFTAANEKRIAEPYDRLYSDATGRLMIDAIRLISNIEPQFYLMENVIGIIDGENKSLLIEEFIDRGWEKPYFTIINAVDWGVPSERLRVFISNFLIENPRLGKQTVFDAISDLPEPNCPTGFEYHTTSPIPPSKEDAIPNLQSGEGLVYFRGTSRDYKNYVRLYPYKTAPVVMGKSRFVHPTEDRLLTPQEHGRLMTFPDDFQYRGTRDQIYDVIGEAIPPKITFQIGEQIKKLL